MFLRQVKSGHEFRAVKNRDLSEVVCFMLFMKNQAGVPSVHPTEIFGQTERENAGKPPFLRPARYTLKSEAKSQKPLRQRVL